MKEAVLISVIIPVYNVKTYLQDCIESVLRQTYRNLQIILVDDGSTDASGEMCDQYAKKDSRITVIHKKNGGLSDARNVGIEYAQGEYIGFVDSDDWIDVDMYQKLLSLILETEADIAVCEAIEVYGDTYYSRASNQKLLLADKQKALDILFEGNKYKCHAWNKLYRKKLFSNIQFPVGRYYEDIFVMHLLYDHSNRIAFLDEGLYYYRQRENSIVHTLNVKAYMDLLEAICLQYDFCKTEKQRNYISCTMLNTIVDIKNELFAKSDKQTIKLYNEQINRYYDACVKGKGIGGIKCLLKKQYRYIPRFMCTFYKIIQCIKK